MSKPLTTWTDEQAADATISVLSEDFTVSTLRSWFKPDPKQTKPSMSEWVSRADHATGMLQVGRALLALRTALAAAEAKLADERKAAINMMNRHRDVVLSLEAKLADAEKHADELAAELEKCNERAYRNAEIAAHYCASKGVSESFMGKQSRKYMDTVFVLTAHAARWAHDDKCESEFDSQVHAQTPCGCAARRAARDGQEGTQ